MMDHQASRAASPRDRLPVFWLVAIALYTATLLTVHPGRPWALTFHEVNFAQPAREFLKRGDWVVPRIVGVPLWDKPPLMHWSIAASMMLFGTEAEWAARLPSMVAAAVVACLIGLLGARWHGRRVGLMAGLVQATSLYVLMQGRLAEADMLLCAAVTAAMTALAFGTLEPLEARWKSRALRLSYFGAAGLAFLAKGPLGPALVGTASGLYALLERRREVWRFLTDPWGWGLMGVLILGWPLVAVASEPGLVEVWWRHNVDRMTGRLGGRKDAFFYFYTIPWLMLPWTPFVVLGLKQALRGRPSPERAAEARFLVTWCGAVVGLLTLSAWKHKHYIIPALPPLSIVAACGLRHCLQEPSPTVLMGVRLVSLGLMGLGLVAGAAGWAAGLPLIAGLGLVGMMGGCGLAAFCTSRVAASPRQALAVMFGTIWMVFVLVQGLVMPGFDLYRGQADLARRASERVPASSPLAVVEIPDPQVVYYLRMPLERHDTWGSFVTRLLEHPEAVSRPFIVVGPRRLADWLARLGPVRELDRSDQVHPRKTEADRMAVFEVRPESARLAHVAREFDEPIKR